MARVQVDYNPGAEALQTRAQPNVQTEQARFDPRANSAFQLAEALGRAQPILDKFNEDQERRRTQEQLLKVDAIKEQVFQSVGSGQVTAAQVKQVAPETVPIVAARVAESMGLDSGRKQINSIIDQINQDDNLRLNSEARNKFIQEQRARIIGEIGKDNQFFVSGVIKGIDQEIKGWENGWQRETATYHTKVQGEAFATEVSQALTAGTDLTEVDKKWGVSSSLNNQERKKIVVDTAIAAAYSTDNPALLDRIPTVFLNDEYKKQITQAKLQIQQIRIGRVRDARFIEQTQREENTRNSKLNIINQLSQGGQIDPAAYRGDPEAFNFAMSMKDAGRLPDTASVAAATRVRTEILNGSTVGTLSQNQVIDQIMQNAAMNPKEKQALIADVPKLMEGMLIMRDESVTSQMSNRLDPVIKAIESGPFADIMQRQGFNIRGQTMSMFQNELQTSMIAWFEDPERGNKQQWPTGLAKQQIIRESIERTEFNISKMTESFTRNAGTGNTRVPPAPAAAPAAPSAAPAARRQPTQADIDFARANPQFRQQFINTFGREP